MNIKFYTEKSTYRTNLSCYRQTRTTLYCHAHRVVHKSGRSVW